MKERPILFQGPMVRAILEGKKTQTRRELKHDILSRPPYFFSGEVCTSLGYAASDGFFWAGFRHKPDWRNVSHPDLLGSACYVKCPYGAPGDRLWVKETWLTSRGLDHCRPNNLAEGAPVEYCADGWREGFGILEKGKIRQSIFMCRWMSRILLEIISVRVEKLNVISEADAIAEGIDIFEDGAGFTVTPGDPWQRNPEDAYRNLWESINGPDSWSLNPSVWVVEFRRIA